MQPRQAPEAAGPVENFRALSIKTTTPDSSSAVSGIFTPPSENGDALPELTKTILAVRWKQALAKCKKDLSMINPADFERMQAFDSVEGLLDDLRKQELAHLRSWATQCTFQVSPALYTLSSAAGYFIGAMFPNVIEMAAIWGVLHLTIQLSIESKHKWEDFVNRLQRIRLSLQVLNRCAKWFDLDEHLEEMSEAIFDVFVNLINFWVEAVKWMRQNPMEQAAKDQLPILNKKFDRAMENVERAVNHLSTLASMDRENMLRQEQKLRYDDLVKRMQISDEKVEYPVKIVPRPVYRGFYGRYEEILDIGTHLDPTSPPTGLQSVLIHGIGGVGKTQTALAFAHRKEPKFDAIFWVQSETKESLKQSFSDIVTGLGLSRDGGNDQDGQDLLRFQAWARTQAARPHGRKWLIIFDNCEKIEDISPQYIPTTPGSILITSRYPTVALRDTYTRQLKPFSEREGLQLLKQLVNWDSRPTTTEADEAALLKLLQKVDGLALGIQAMAALMNSQGKSVPDFLAFFNKYSRKLWMKADRAEDYDKDSTRVVGREHILDNVWRMSFNGLSEEASSLLGLMSFLAADVNSAVLFDMEEITEDDGIGDDDMRGSNMLSVCQDEFELSVAVTDLQKAALISSTDSLLSMHRLVQDAFIYTRSPAQQQECFNAAVFVLYTAFPKQVNHRTLFPVWDQCRNYIQHAQRLAERFRELRVGKTPIKPPPYFAHLLNSCTWYLYEAQEHKAALDLLEVAYLAVPEKVSPLYVQLRATAGACYIELNDLILCREALEDSLATHEKLPTDGNPDADEVLGAELHDLGCLTSSEGNQDAALDLFRRADVIRARVGTDSLGLTRMSIARSHALKGESEKALEFYLDAEQIFEAKYGPRQYMYAFLEYGRGIVEFDRGKLDIAITHFKAALQFLEAAMPLSMVIASCYYKLACISWMQKDNETVLAYIEQGLTIAEHHQARGDMARLLRKKSQIIQEEDPRMAMQLLNNAEMMTVGLLGGRNIALDETDATWDQLVCCFWR